MESARKKTLTRRKHSNSKHGCLQCKKRRIKCGQELPQCKHCVSYRSKVLRCSYMDLTEQERSAIFQANLKSEPNITEQSRTSKITKSKSPKDKANKIAQKDDTLKNSIINLPSPQSPILNKAHSVPTKFKLLRFKTLEKNSTHIQKVVSFIINNLTMPVADTNYTIYFKFVYELWVSTAIEDAFQSSSSNFHAIMAWSSAYLSNCIRMSLQGYSKSHFGTPSIHSSKSIEDFAHKNNFMSIQLLSKAISNSNYRQLLDCLISNTFIANSDYSDHGYFARYTHLSGLVAILYELYLHTSNSTYYIQGLTDYQTDEMNLMDSLTRSNDSNEIKSLPQKFLTTNVSNGPTLPGYSHFSDSSPHEQVLIKFFEWQVFLSTVSIFLPNYNYRCLLEFQRCVEDFQAILVKVNIPLLTNYANNIISYLEYLTIEIFPQLENDGTQEVFCLPPKVIYQVYLRYHLATPSELSLAITKQNSLSTIEKILYRYHLTLGKIMDHVFPEARYIFLTGFISTYYQYADDVEVFPEVDHNFEEYLVPKESGFKPDSDMLSELQYHIHYCQRTFSFFFNRGLLLHKGIVLNNPFPDFVKQSPWESRKITINEVEIISFDNTFIRPEHYPHTIRSAAQSNDSDNDQKGFWFEGRTIEDLAMLNVSKSIENHKSFLHFSRPKEMLGNREFKKYSSGLIAGYDFSMKPTEIQVAVRHWVGKTLRELYEDRSSIYKYYEKKEVEGQS